MFNALENVSKATHQFLLFEKRNDNSERQAENVKEEVDEFLVRFRLLGILKIGDFRLFYYKKERETHVPLSKIILFYFISFELVFF